VSELRPIIPPEAIAELATTIAAAFVAGVETVAGNYGQLHAELAELRDELHALANRIESATRHMGLPDAERAPDWQATEPAPGWTLAGPYLVPPTWRAFQRTAEGHVYRLGHEDYDAAAAWVLGDVALVRERAEGDRS
jgi:uncharacterized membrane protein